MSKKNERVQKLIALSNMIEYQKRDASGCAKFNKGQLDAALSVLKDVLALDNIMRIEN